MRAMASAVRAASARLDGREERDLLTFLELCLGELVQSVEATATAWEKRGYWLKADRFRHDWAWADRLGRSLRDALDRSDQEGGRAVGMELATHLGNARPLASLIAARPWMGAWDKRNGTSQRPPRS